MKFYSVKKRSDWFSLSTIGAIEMRTNFWYHRNVFCFGLESWSRLNKTLFSGVLYVCMGDKKRFLLPITFYCNYYKFPRVWLQPSLFPHRSSVVACISFKNKLNLRTNYVFVPPAGIW
jgi:hypothetical protein